MQKIQPTSIRFPAEILSALKELSKKENRSVSQQVVYMLKKILENEKAAK